MNPSFVPQFENSHIMVGPTMIYPVNPQCCASLVSAHQLCDILADLKPTIVMADPMPTANAKFRFAEKVPWLQFPSGYRERAGLIQMWWVRFPNGDANAERFCRAQIAADDKNWQDNQKEIAEQMGS